MDMKTATIPSVRVEPEFRDEVEKARRREGEKVLGKNESLSQFVEAAVRASVRQRKDQAEFVARGVSSLRSARKRGEYFDASEVMRRLRAKLDSRRPGKHPVLGDLGDLGSHGRRWSACTNWYLGDAQDDRSECEQQADRVSAGRLSTADWVQLIPAHRVCRLIPTVFVQVADPGRLCCRAQVALETGLSRRRRT